MTGEDMSVVHAILITGIDDIRAAVLALPRLAAFRAEHATSRIVTSAPLAVRDVLTRLRLIDQVRVSDGQSRITQVLWLFWQRLTGMFARIVDVNHIAGTGDVDWSKLQRDVSFRAPPQPYVLLGLADGFPALRAAAVLRKLQMLDYNVGVIGLRNSVDLDRVCQSVPDAHDLVGHFDLADIVPLAANAAAVIGGGDGLCELAALSGARTVILTTDQDSAIDILPAQNTIWLQSADLSYIGVNDILAAAVPS